MRMLYVFMLCLVLACSNDQSPSSQQNNDSQEVSGQPSNQLTNAAPQTQGSISLKMGQANASPGSEVCLPVTVGGFQQILSTQYSIKWDPQQLTFKTLKAFGLPGLDERGFGLPLAEKGILTCVWIDNALRGVSLDDGAKIYDICFEVASDINSNAVAVSITNDPTPFESVNLQEQVLTIIPENGGVIIQ